MGNTAGVTRMNTELLVTLSIVVSVVFVIVLIRKNRNEANRLLLERDADNEVSWYGWRERTLDSFLSCPSMHILLDGVKLQETFSTIGLRETPGALDLSFGSKEDLEKFKNRKRLTSERSIYFFGVDWLTRQRVNGEIRFSERSEIKSNEAIGTAIAECEIPSSKTVWALRQGSNKIDSTEYVAVIKVVIELSNESDCDCVFDQFSKGVSAANKNTITLIYDDRDEKGNRFDLADYMGKNDYPCLKRKFSKFILHQHVGLVE